MDDLEVIGDILTRLNPPKHYPGKHQILVMLKVVAAGVSVIARARGLTDRKKIAASARSILNDIINDNLTKFEYQLLVIIANAADLTETTPFDSLSKEAIERYANFIKTTAKKILSELDASD